MPVDTRKRKAISDIYHTTVTIYERGKVIICINFICTFPLARKLARTVSLGPKQTMYGYGFTTDSIKMPHAVYNIDITKVQRKTDPRRTAFFMSSIYRIQPFLSGEGKRRL